MNNKLKPCPLVSEQIAELQVTPEQLVVYNKTLIAENVGLKKKLTLYDEMVTALEDCIIDACSHLSPRERLAKIQKTKIILAKVKELK